MPKWLKFLVGLLLLPLCYGAVSALLKVVRASGGAENFWVAFCGGAACWLVVFVLLPKPMWVYVFGHELTHALWVWLMGGRVKKFKATSSGGHVVVTKNNFLISLAPYFCPIYAITVILTFLVMQQFWTLKFHMAWFHLIIGASYSFHVTLTWHALQVRQTDITEQGYLFSAVIIFLGNLVVLLLGIPLLTEQVRVIEALRFWWNDTSALISGIKVLFS